MIDQNGSTTYQKNPQNPSGFQETERIDVKGGAHKNGAGIPVPTPHKHVKGQKEVQPLDPSKDVIPQYLPDIKPLPLPPPPPAVIATAFELFAAGAETTAACVPKMAKSEKCDDWHVTVIAPVLVLQLLNGVHTPVSYR